MAQVRGAIITGLFRYLKETFGSEAVPQTLELCKMSRRVFANPIDSAGWYHYSAFVEPLEIAVKLFDLYDPQGFVRFGRWAARFDIKTYGLGDLGMQQPLELIHCSNYVWQTNYREAGHVSVIGEGVDSCKTSIHFDGMAHSHCLLMQGWADEFSRTVLDHLKIETVLHTCRHQGGEASEYLSRWVLPREETAEPPTAKPKVIGKIDLKRETAALVEPNDLWNEVDSTD